MSQKYTYTAADLERYHSGKMSAEEMHAIEKAALEDPFLADALEGYVFTNTPVKDVAELRERLFAKKKKKNVFFLMSKQNALLRIAAMFILIAGIGYLTYKVNTGKKNNMIAIKQDSLSLKDTQQQSLVKPDSIINEKEGLTITAPAVKRNAYMKQEHTAASPDLQIAEDVSEKPVTYLRDQTLPNTMAAQLQKNTREMNILKGRVVDTLGNPIRYATIRDKESNIITSSDSTGRFKMPATDTMVTATISIIGYATKEKKLSRHTEGVIVMEPNNQDLQGVVVTAMGARSKKVLGYENVLQGKVAGVSVNSSQPDGGWQKLNEYVQKNIKIPADTSGKNYKGTVILSFETNKKGTPKKIKVVRSLCTECDKEAIRLLTNGPKWKHSKARQTVPIQF